MSWKAEVSSIPNVSVEAEDSSSPIMLGTPCGASNEKTHEELQTNTQENSATQISDEMETASYTTLKRHRDSCVVRKMKLETAQEQTGIHFLPVDSVDMEKMREAAAYWILMHEHPFTILEEEGFNLMLEMPGWQEISENTIKADCVAVYELEKKKLKNLLKSVDKVNLIIDLWKSRNQKIDYMVITGQWINSSWELQKRVLSFVDIPPPRRGIEIADAIFRCLKEWDIENKIYAISVDNASPSDVTIRILKDNFSRSKNLVCGRKLFHVQCFARVLNLMAQYGLDEIIDIVENIRESLDYVTCSDERLLLFAKIVQQLQLPGRKLIRDCTTRWNSTCEMLSCAVKFKEVFLRLRDRDPLYDCCPSAEDWDKLEKVCAILEIFLEASHIISRSDYPASNLFLQEVLKIKLVLDKRADDEDDNIRAVVHKMKLKFDKYWGECYLLMAIAAILDPRQKMRAMEFYFPRICTQHEVEEKIAGVKRAIFDLYDEYVAGNNLNEIGKIMETEGGGSSSNGGVQRTTISVWDEFNAYCEEIEKLEPQKSELVNYLDMRLQKNVANADPQELLNWWKSNRLTYPVLSKMACDILAIPISTVTSVATFSAGTRVIDDYRASLPLDIVQVLICGGDWCRHLYGVKQNIEMEITQEISLPIP